MQVNAFNETQKNCFRGIQCCVALQSMTYAADELQENKDEQGISDVIMSCKGSWQKRGHSSLNGVTLVLLLDIRQSIKRKNCI